MLELKTHYTASELAEFKIPSFPKTQPGIFYKAKKENWEYRERDGRGGGIEYGLSCLPLVAQEFIRNKIAVSILSTPKTVTTTNNVNKKLTVLRNCPVLLENQTAGLTEKQRVIADARIAIVAEVLRLESLADFSRIAAIRSIIQKIQQNSLPPELMQQALIANARKGTSRNAVSERTLNQWVLDYLRAKNSAECLFLLAPRHNPGKAIQDIAWLPHFLAHYRQPNGVSIAEAYRDFTAQWQKDYADQPAMLMAIPSIHAVHRAMAKLPKLTRMKGRVTGAAFKAIKTYVKRDWNQLKVNDIWIGDGHSMKMKVAHPDHGRPFIPEVTMIIDGASRYIVGWSVSLSENCIAVSDALRYGIEKNGAPLIYYTDNGGGEKNKLLDADVTGILPRLGIQHETGIAGNPQGRGIIERAHQTILYRVARQFATFHGHGADRDHVRIVSRSIESAVNAVSKDKELTTYQRSALAKLPSWNQFIDVLRDGIDYYNTQHRHSELPKHPDGRHFTPAEFRVASEEKLIFLTDIELRDMFRPQVTRTAQRGWISLFNNDYFAEDLIQVDGEQVIVSFDIHNAESVIIRRLDGSYLCEAIFNGNKRAAFAVPMVEKLRNERANRRMKLVEQKAEAIRAELNPVIDASTTPDFGMLLEGEFSRQQEPEELFLFQSERDEHIKRRNA